MSVKRDVEDLAVFGGMPQFSELLHVGRPNIGDRTRILALFDGMLERRWLSNDGPYLQEFEERIATLAGVRHCVALANATLALEFAARACGLTGEVIVPSFTFIATPHALQWQGIRPVFCEIDERTHNIDSARIEELITPHTTGILAVHLWGRPAPIAELERIARRHGLRLIFDAAHALACTSEGRRIGGFGDAEVFSFHATKLVNTFEGGAVVTNDDVLADRVREMRNFGITGYDEVTALGINGKMNEASAAMGIAGLESLDQFIACNKRNYSVYREGLGDIEGLRLCAYNEDESNNYQYVVFELQPNARLTRDQLLKVLVAEGVLARRYFFPGCHRSEPYRSLFPDLAERLPVTDAVASRVVALPTGASIDEEIASTIANLVRFVLGNAGEIAQRIGLVAPDEVYADRR